MVHHHPNERADHHRRIHLDHRPVFLSFGYVVTQELINPEHKLLEKHLREFVAFECRVEQQSLKFGIAVMMR